MRGDARSAAILWPRGLGPIRIARVLLAALVVARPVVASTSPSTSSFGRTAPARLAVTAVADADVVDARRPGLAADLRFDDATAAGWAVEGPTATRGRRADGHAAPPARRRPRRRPTCCTASARPSPTCGWIATIDGDDRRSTALSGRLVARPAASTPSPTADLLAAVGGTPFADELAAAGATPATRCPWCCGPTCPGEVETTGSAADGTVTWSDAPLDGSSVDLATDAEQRPAPAWASYRLRRGADPARRLDRAGRRAPPSS